MFTGSPAIGQFLPKTPSPANRSKLSRSLLQQFKGISSEGLGTTGISVHRTQFLAMLFTAVTLATMGNGAIADRKGKFPGQGSYRKWVEAYKFADEATAQRHLGQIDGAIAKAKEAIQIYPFDSVFYHNLGNYLALKKDFPAAIIQYKRVILLDPNDSEAYYNLGYSYDQLKNRKLAEEYYLKSLKLNPNYADALFNLASIQLELDQFDKAKESLLKAGNIHGVDRKSVSDGLREVEQKRLLKQGGK